MSFLDIALGKISKKYSNPPICGLDIIVGSRRIGFAVIFDAENSTDIYPLGKTIYQEYENSKVKWIRNDKDREKKLKNQDFSQGFFTDFETVLRRLGPAKLGKFGVKFAEMGTDFLERYIPIFETLPKIKTKSVELVVNSSQIEVMGVLKYLDADYLKSIEIKSPGDENGKLLVDDVSKLEQWKKAEHLNTEDIDVMAGIRTFETFRNVEISYPGFTMDNVKELEEIFLHSPIPQKFHILSMNNYNIIQSLIENYGPPFLDTVERTRTRKSWFFKIPNNQEQVIRISLFAILMQFIRIPIEEKPTEARVIG